MWIGIALLVLFVVYALIVAVFSFYVSSPSTHNATAFNKKISNQYYRQDDKVVYVRQGNFFQIGEETIEEADPESFDVIDQYYAKDSHYIYYNGNPVAEANPSSVTPITSAINTNTTNSGYLISNGHVFYNGQIITGADPDSFSYIIGAYGMDKESLYYYIDTRIPRKTMPTIISNTDGQYIKHGEQILYQGQIISNDADRFTIINDEYSKDSRHVYSHGEIIDGMVADSFTIISPYYRKDKNQVYFFNTPIPNSDPDTFKILNDTITKDQTNLYYNGNIIDNKKPSEVNRSEADKLKNIWEWQALHLEVTRVILAPSDDVEDITNDFYAYNNEVYTRYKKLIGVKPKDVIVLDPEDKTFVRIDNHLFFYGATILGAEPETFTIISDRFSKDANNVYWSEHRIVNTDPATFKYADNLYVDENEAGDYYLKATED